MRTIFDDHPSSAELADLIGLLICDMDSLQGSLRLFHRFHKIRVEVSYDGLPRGQALADAV